MKWPFRGGLRLGTGAFVGAFVGACIGLAACQTADDETPTPTPFCQGFKSGAYPDCTQPPEATPTPSPTPVPDPTIVSGGNVQGSWCGRFQVTGNVTVPADTSLEICPGSHITFGAYVGIRVEGTLLLSGTSEAPVQLLPDSSTDWAGLTIRGTLDGKYALLEGASLAINGLSGSHIQLQDSVVKSTNFVLQLVNGGTFERSTFLGDQTIFLAGGLLKMTDTLIDFQHPAEAPDCIDVSGGGLELDHVKITGCHCTLHIEGSTLPNHVTHSILEGAVDAVMLEDTIATFTGNHLIGAENDILDIGEEEGGIQAAVGGNYWGGGAPWVTTPFLAQFTGLEDYSEVPLEDVGPRL